jgi:uncharacterized membrane protein SpoIIM required for sporulation
MILDLEKFLAQERPHWEALEALLNRLDTGDRLQLDDARRMHALYERASADLARLATFAAEPESRRYLEALVARAYAEIHETRGSNRRFRFWHWFLVVFPQTFRRHARAFAVSLGISLVGTLFGIFATIIDPDSRHVTMPFGHSDITPTQRVEREEAEQAKAAVHSQHASFSGQLMTHNTQVSIGTLALGMTWGIGTVILLFYNGVVLGAIGTDYITDGQGGFLAAWLLPHGSIELPAIFIAGQAGLVLAHTLFGRRSNLPLGRRLRAVAPDLVTLIGGVALLLVYAGIIESFLSQYHEPVVPYSLKIAFGLAELAGLVLFLTFAGRSSETPDPGTDPSAP